MNTSEWLRRDLFGENIKLSCKGFCVWLYNDRCSYGSHFTYVANLLSKIKQKIFECIFKHIDYGYL